MMVSLDDNGMVLVENGKHLARLAIDLLRVVINH